MLPTLFLLALASPTVPPADERATLSGVVQDADGKGLAGARVRLSTAAPRKGAGQL